MCSLKTNVLQVELARDGTGAKFYTPGEHPCLLKFESTDIYPGESLRVIREEKTVFS